MGQPDALLVLTVMLLACLMSAALGIAFGYAMGRQRERNNQIMRKEAVRLYREGRGMLPKEYP
jgi:hypothetical protein